ncbi:RNA polymerase sigma factor [Plantactinospora sp. DSM 117369]
MVSIDAMRPETARTPTSVPHLALLRARALAPSTPTWRAGGTVIGPFNLNRAALTHRVRPCGSSDRAYYRAHFDIVQNYLARRVREPERVADLTADVFLAAIDGAPRYRPTRGTVRAWTYGIARNVLLADLRRT